MTDVDETTALLRDIRTLMWVGVRDALEEMKHDAFRGEQEQMQAYAGFARGLSTREIGRAIGKSHTTVQRWIDHWRECGLVDTEGAASLSPQMLGIEESD